MKKVLITSSLMYDFIMDFPERFSDQILPHKITSLSLTFRVGNMSKNFGGNGGNIAYTLSLLSTPSTLLTSIGKNDGEAFLEHLKKHHVDTSYVNVVDNEFTGNCFIMTDMEHNQITAYYPGALRDDINLTLKSIKDLTDHQLLVISTSTPEAQINFVKQAIELGIPYVYAPGQEIGRLSKEQLRIGLSHAKVIIMNDYEVALTVKITELTHKDFFQNAELLITTLGKEGSTLETKDGTKISIGIAPTQQTIDPTGAGDAYVAGFVAGYIQGLPLKTAGQMGALTATYAIEHYGPQNHAFTKEEFENRYADSFKEVLTLTPTLS